MERLKLLLSPEVIAKRVQKLGREISSYYRDQEVVLIGILKGAFVFLADLVRALDLSRVEVDFVRLKSYGFSDTSAGEVQITKDVELSLRGKHVLVVEDIVDTGYTLAYLLEHLRLHEPASVRVCCFVDKSERRKVEVPIHFKAFEIPSGFLVGYGLDFAERYRHLPGLYEVIRE
ncbi:hypoxanthine phosphoribosyltransferase [Thermosulfurimonas sp. F29]|uniref:hypoxanthine phosphoribosyltransferase n=1 Tax=Thermosulfurimonas sp. F29 TaxID=2867247 RepID=UPI001C82D223|nr:hypoxanthine phosphoribosyltransferase [Thermosulfurimonas sp. F29]MBX6422545.1 hypoxanthine phosphoribosyltransferase [Thermosulfurimonas sp. F29]